MKIGLLAIIALAAGCGGDEALRWGGAACLFSVAFLIFAAACGYKISWPGGSK